MKNGLILKSVSKSFGKTQALSNVSFEVSKGEVVAILGPSGCGKSTTLSLIAGLEKSDHGCISWEGVSLEDIPSNQRDFGLMFQDLALFPHLNVADNVSFGLRMANWTAAKIVERVHEMLQIVGLVNFAQRDVNTLSGGEQQRVALARSLAPSPRLLMLDEPLGALDRNLRERLVLELRQILTEMRQTALYVTHDQDEAFAIADRVVVMNSGRVEQVGTPQDVYHQPASAFVARFLGLNNLFPAEAIMQAGRHYLVLPFGTIPIEQNYQGKGLALLRPDEVQIDGKASHELVGIVEQRSFRGNLCRAVVKVGNSSLAFDFLSNACVPAEGERVKLSFEPAEAVQFFHDEHEALSP